MKAKKPKPTKHIRWHCKDCLRRGTVKVEQGEQLARIVSDIYAAHDKGWALACPEYDMHVNL